MARLLDITRPLDRAEPTWPGDRPYERTVKETVLGGRPCLTSALALSAHQGTHLDAPTHLLPAPGPSLEPPTPWQAPEEAPDRRWTVDQVPPEVLVGPARVADLTHLGRVDAAAIHTLPPGPARLLLRTRRQEGPPDMAAFTALTEEAARAVVSRACVLLGTDAPSVDPADSDDLPAHRVLLDAGVVILEGLDLSRAPAGDYELLCLPLKVKGGEAAPARVFLRG